MVGPIFVPAVVLLYQGVKEAWKFTYIAPAVPKGIPGNSGWEELRYRYPSPGNDPANGQFAVREMQRHHYKTPYYKSRYNVRHYWDRKFQNGEGVHYYGAPDPATLSAREQSLLLGFIEGEDAYNNERKKSYDEIFKEKTHENSQNELYTSIMDKSPLELIQDLAKEAKELEEIDGWDDIGDTPTASKYLTNPDTYLHDYGLHHWTSYDMLPYIELEQVLEDLKDELIEDGAETRSGNSNNWRVLDSSHRRDQQQEVVKTLKQRNVGKQLK